MAPGATSYLILFLFFAFVSVFMIIFSTFFLFSKLLFPAKLCVVDPLWKNRRIQRLKITSVWKTEISTSFAKVVTYWSMCQNTKFRNLAQLFLNSKILLKGLYLMEMRCLKRQYLKLANRITYVTVFHLPKTLRIFLETASSGVYFLFRKIYSCLRHWLFNYYER